MNKVYIVLFKDNTMELYPTKQEQEMFQNATRCFSCKAETSIDTVRELVYIILPKYGDKWTEYGRTEKIFKREW